MRPLFEIETPYAFATSEVQKNGAVFFTLHNHTPEPITITAAQSDVAEKLELHTHSMDRDSMMMREVEAFVAPANESHALEPMGDHIMLMGLKRQLHVGDRFEVILKTAAHDDVRVSVDVIAPGTKPVKPEPVVEDGKLY